MSIAGCKPIIALNDCHLKDPYGGHLLCVVGRSGNDDIFSISYAIVETKCRESWTWFKGSLLDSIGLVHERRWVFMSNR